MAFTVSRYSPTLVSHVEHLEFRRARPLLLPSARPQPFFGSAAARTWNSFPANSASPPPPSPDGATTSSPAARPR